MIGSKQSTSLKWLGLAGACAVLSAAAFGLSSCNEEDPAEAMLASRGGASTPPPAAGAPPASGAPGAGAPDAGGPSAAMPGAGAPGAAPSGGAAPGGAMPPGGLGGAMPPAGGPGGPAAAPGGPAGAIPANAEQPAGPKVILTLKDVKAPYPEFTGRGNYSIKLSVEGTEPTDFAVWEFVAFDEKDKEVGRIPQAVKIPYKSVKNLEFTNVYFLAEPVRFEVHLTDKKAIRADSGLTATKDGAEGGPRAGGADLGGGSPPPDGGGAGGGGGAPAAPPPGNGGGDGGGGKGGEEEGGGSE